MTRDRAASSRLEKTWLRAVDGAGGRAAPPGCALVELPGSACQPGSAGVGCRLIRHLPPRPFPRGRRRPRRPASCAGPVAERPRPGGRSPHRRVAPSASAPPAPRTVPVGSAGTHRRLTAPQFRNGQRDVHALAAAGQHLLELGLRPLDNQVESVGIALEHGPRRRPGLVEGGVWWDRRHLRVAVHIEHGGPVG
jgi:hypothetical protein